MTQQQEQPLTLQDYLENFPFPEIRPKQREALEAICDAFN
jgi:hypothetical protein